MSEKAEKKVIVRPKVSIVVPIYNVEKYLRECVDSILGQTLKDIEVILVDDGSPDGSGKIIDNYAKKDKRVVPIHKENGGYSKAVNYGISIAKGEYIGIIESDDWIEPDMYELLYDSAKKYNTDVTKGEFFYYNSKNIGPEHDFRFTNGGGRVDLDYAPEGAFHVTEFPQIIAYHASIWSCIYRADFVKKIKLIDTAGASYQDFPFMVEVMTKAKRISVVKKPLVHWRNDPKQGNSTSAKGKKLLHMPENTMNSLNILRDSGLYEPLKEAFYAQAIWANTAFLYNIAPEYQEEYFNACKKVFAPLQNDKHFKFKYYDENDTWLAGQYIYCTYDEFRKNDSKRRWRGRFYRLACVLSPKYRSNKFIEGLEKENKLHREIAQELKHGRWN